MSEIPMHPDECEHGNTHIDGVNECVVCQRDEARAQLAEVSRERDALKRHYQAAAPEHNLLALLDLFMEREHEAERQRDEYKRLYFAAIDDRDAMQPVYDAALAWSRPGCSAAGWGCDGCERCRSASNALYDAIDAAQAAEGEE